ncbi:unnamed protein product [Acanthoscelides obtectus]|nr:unnamed protein product [Acanthoscelides obtectus]CAK1671287.1 hypothetical protein AOBTE_LOCUS28208 [Acanthoscelides obtectus]
MFKEVLKLFFLIIKIIQSRHRVIGTVLVGVVLSVVLWLCGVVLERVLSHFLHAYFVPALKFIVQYLVYSAI